jgi:hypothetical protein
MNDKRSNLRLVLIRNKLIDKNSFAKLRVFAEEEK